MIVKNNQILATGYNGSPKRVRHCSETGCLRERLNVPSGERHELCRGVHAEQNAIIQAAVNGTQIHGSSVYCTHQPCVICSKMLINAEIESIYIKDGYPDELAKEMLTEAGIEIYQIDIEADTISKM